MVIRFEVTRVTDTRSLVKGSRASSCEVMFWNRWTRLAMAFGANFASEAKKMLAEAEKVARALGKNYLSAATTTENKAAIKIVKNWMM